MSFPVWFPSCQAVNRLSSQRIFQSPSKNEIFTSSLSQKKKKAGTAGSYSWGKCRLAKAFNLKSGWALVELGIDEGIEGGECRRSGMPPLRDAASVRGGPARPPPCPPTAGLPAPACARRASQHPRPPAKKTQKNPGMGKGRMRRDSCRPFLQATRASRDAGVGKGDRTPEEVPRGTGLGVRWVWRASAGGEEVYSGKAIVCP